MAEAANEGCSIEKVFLKISHNSQEKKLCYSLFFNKVVTATFWNLKQSHFPINILNEIKKEKRKMFDLFCNITWEFYRLVEFYKLLILIL